MTTIQASNAGLRALSDSGLEPTPAHDGVDGLRKFFELRPSLVVLDVKMPGMDGIQTLEQIGAMSDVPVLMLTGRASSRTPCRDCARVPTTTSASRLDLRLVAHSCASAALGGQRVGAAEGLGGRSGDDRLREGERNSGRFPRCAHAFRVQASDDVRRPPRSRPRGRPAARARVGRVGASRDEVRSMWVTFAASSGRGLSRADRDGLHTAAGPHESGVSRAPARPASVLS